MNEKLKIFRRHSRLLHVPNVKSIAIKLIIITRIHKYLYIFIYLL